jgi:cytoskeleton protein RodZ
MDEILSKSQDETATHPLTGIGARLKAAREALHLSEKEVAGRLYLNIQVIFKMEQEDFSNIPVTFMRGYLRSYARLLQLDENELADTLKQVNLVLPNSANNSKPSTIKRSDHHHHVLDRYLRWSSYGIISVLFVLVIVWWSSHPRFNDADPSNKQMAQVGPSISIENTTTPNQTAADLNNSTAANNPIVAIPPLLARPAPVTKTAAKETTKENRTSSTETPVKTAETHKAPKSTHHLDMFDEEDNEKYIDQNNIY